MNCQTARENAEAYLAKELSEPLLSEIQEHLTHCLECRQMYEDTSRLIENLRKLPPQIELKSILEALMLENIARKEPKPMKTHRYSIIAAAAATLLFILSSTLLAFPALAQKYTPSLPIAQDLNKLQDKTAALKSQAESYKTQAETYKTEVEALKVQIQKIDGTEIKVVETQSGLSPEDNTQIQSLALSFIKAQYKGDMAQLQAMTTPEFYATILKRKSEFIWTGRGGVIFSSITNVAQEKEGYVVFVRISDSSDDSEFQEDFTITKTATGFKIQDMGLDK